MYVCLYIQLNDIRNEAGKKCPGIKTKGMQCEWRVNQNLPATCSVAFLLRAIPQSFSAIHQYEPVSLSRRECTTCIWRAAPCIKSRKKEEEKENQQSIALNTLTLKIYTCIPAGYNDNETKLHSSKDVFFSSCILLVLLSLGLCQSRNFFEKHSVERVIAITMAMFWGNTLHFKIRQTQPVWERLLKWIA